MSVPIRKPLSRKFNNSRVNLAGLLTCFMLFYLPIRLWRTVVSKKTTSSFEEVPR